MSWSYFKVNTTTDKLWSVFNNGKLILRALHSPTKTIHKTLGIKIMVCDDIYLRRGSINVLLQSWVKYQWAWLHNCTTPRYNINIAKLKSLKSYCPRQPLFCINYNILHHGPNSRVIFSVEQAEELYSKHWIWTYCVPLIMWPGDFQSLGLHI